MWDLHNTRVAPLYSASAGKEQRCVQVLPAACWSACIICSTVLTVAVFCERSVCNSSLDASYCSSHCILYLSGLGFGHFRAERDTQDYLCCPDVAMCDWSRAKLLCETVLKVHATNKKSSSPSSTSDDWPQHPKFPRNAQGRPIVRRKNHCQLTNSDLLSSSPNWI